MDVNAGKTQLFQKICLKFLNRSVVVAFAGISFFEDQAAVDRWRALAEHRAAQRLGREGIFSDYRLKVTHVLRDYGMHQRAEAPADSRAHHDT